ncbi:MAG: fatty acid desaturase [Acidobacteria bacterium]|nr:fatty acid desaturase [Acidobacteriota bacterium]HCA59175.1 acyl-CoA desaturase [Blastocatellia bacterium]
MRTAISNRAGADSLNLTTLFFVVVFHVLAVGAFFTFSWQNLGAFLVLWWVSGSLGIGLGYHRLLTHRGFKVPKWLEYTLSLFGTLALQSGPLSWVSTHRIHHAFTDQENDPHSPRHGTYWAHIGWIFRGTSQNQTEETMRRYCPDMIDDNVHRVLNRFYWVPTVVVGVALLAIGGVGMLFWGIFLRTVMGWHFTWLVNSATHLWGSRRFETRDDSRNNGLVAALSWGEGWHNNHHAHPRSARHGLAWYEIDINWIQLRLLEMVGLARDIYAYDTKKQKERKQVKLDAVTDAA